MVKHDQTWFYIALVITIGIHISVVSPLSNWYDRMMMPMLADESIIVELNKILPQKKLHSLDLLKESLLKPDPKNLPPAPPIQTFIRPVKRKLSEAGSDQNISPRVNPLTQKNAALDAASMSDPQKGKTPLTEQEDIQSVIPDKDPKERPDTVSRDQSQQPLNLSKQAGDKKELDGDRQQDEKNSLVENSSDMVSPLLIRKKDQAEKKTDPIPEEVTDTFRGGQPEKTSVDYLQFSMNTYKWTFERFVENWAADLQKWWKAPVDYVFGNFPEGGDVWIQVKLSKSGRLTGYKVYDSKVSSEMELKVVQALIGSLKRPSLPEAFFEEELIINWRFIYPPIRPPIQLRR